MRVMHMHVHMDGDVKVCVPLDLYINVTLLLPCSHVSTCESICLPPGVRDMP